MNYEISSGNKYVDEIEFKFYRLKYWQGETQYEKEELRIVKVIRKVQDNFDG